MSEVSFDDIAKVYDDGTRAVSELTLAIGDGEFMVLVGPSGCGKTTALRMVAGLEEISEGELRIGDRVVNRTPPRDRDIAMVFQSYALYPHLTVYDNIAFGLRLRGTKKDEVETRVRRAADTLGLTEYLGRKPKALSGGQRQRVAMGRAIVREPSAFLMDEPLSNLDAKLRVQMRAEIAELQNRLGVTTIYVTHDQIEAMTMGDRVAVMRKGRLQQVAPPQELYDHPVNLFVASFIGSPAMNVLAATLEDDREGLVARLSEHHALRLDVGALEARPALRAYTGREVIVGIRPEALEDAALLNGDGGDRLEGEVVLREALGSEIVVHALVDAHRPQTEELQELAEEAADAQLSSGDTEDGVRLVGRFSPRSQVREGDRIAIAVETRDLHFFDPASGAGIYDDVMREETA